MTKIKVALMRDLDSQVAREEISYSRMVEILNETVTSQFQTQLSEKDREILILTETVKDREQHANFNMEKRDELQKTCDEMHLTLVEKDREIEQERQKSKMLYEVIDWIIKSKHIWINDKDESNGVVDLLKLRLKEYNQPQPGDSGTKQDKK